MKKNIQIIMVFLLLFFKSPAVFGSGFLFQELSLGGEYHEPAFLKMIQLSRERTSLRFSEKGYQRVSAQNLSAGILPRLPYLFLYACSGGQPRSLPDSLIPSLNQFLMRGGILYIQSCGKPNQNQILSLQKKFRQPIRPLPRDHAIYKSFFLLSASEIELYGAVISASTQRTALILSFYPLQQKILQQEETAIHLAINVLMYMLTGNYKSDQVHTQQILQRIRQRGMMP